ncbi:hypothetical protein ACFY7C_00490 [Streptomyces sp. NPDC012769]|uniref:hypothetical protein n=1 Tax=Streptomyces sp. NPDC012769 TaxID=3364848 RepID=UPI0036CC8571
MRIASKIGVALAGAALALGGTAASAQASTSTEQALPPLPSWCVNGDEWDDDYTYGATCSGSQVFYARVTCKNGSGQTSYARGQDASYGGWSYAYCSSKGPGWKVVPYSGTAIKR